jgi:HEPN domain-containing protein
LKYLKKSTFPTLSNGFEFPWTHSIVDLLDELKEKIYIEEDIFSSLSPSSSDSNQYPYR